MKKLSFFLTLILLSIIKPVVAQMVTEDLAQVSQNATMIAQGSEQISIALEQFKQMKQVYDQGKESYKEFIQINQYLQNAEERLKQIGDIKQLKLNNINTILERVFCIKQGNYWNSSVRFLDIIGKIKAGFLNCDNREIYNKTYAGMLENFNNRSVIAANIGEKELITKMNELNTGLVEAEKTETVMAGHNAHMKLELGLKYKALSDELMDLSEELHLAINQDGASEKNVEMSKADRMKMMDLANQYQLQAMQFEEKSAQLLQEASELDKQQAKVLLKTKRQMAIKQIINAHL